MHLVIFLLEILNFRDFFKNHVRNGSREENLSLKQHFGSEFTGFFFPTALNSYKRDNPALRTAVMCTPDHSCFSHTPKDTPALPFTGSAPTAASSTWVGSLKQLENEPFCFFFFLLHGHHSPEQHQQSSLPHAQHHNDFSFLPGF